MVTLFKPGIHQTHETKQYREEDVIWTSLFLMNRPGKGYLSSNCLETRSQIGGGEVLVAVQKAERETPGLGGAILNLLFQYSLLYCSP